ncbi:anti-sigma factor antagonist [Amycolatopsis acidicola]|uniref:Anti-sigma factor antagonist n=1 Tax=Amycolatopsis acidicola TaxID=2596893 RepID=A0A5N0UKX3_9PSEU|nr:anti-sigma factor antagonist [Amycolatopsis acidicola]KAA9150303.1 anti-sigma factor antagonist [Amycolatopsis acidicola]
MAHTSGIPSDLLRISRELDEGAVVLRVAGDVDLSTAGKLSDQLRTAEDLAVPPKPLIADFDKVDFLGSAGLVVLANEYESCQEQGIPLRIVSTSRAVLRSITVAGLSGVLSVVPTVEKALAPA